MCGSKSSTIKAIVEGVELNVCKGCAKFGKVAVRPRIRFKERRQPTLPEHEVLEMIVSDYAGKIKQARESLNLKQEDLAKRLNERESLIHRIESGHVKPSMKIAKKLEKFLHVKLIEKHEEVHQKKETSKSNAFTIGDIIKIKDKG